MKELPLTNNISKKAEKIILAEISKKENEINSTFSSSEITFCVRKNFYKVISPDKNKNTEGFLEKRDKFYRKQKWIDLFSLSYKVDVLEKNKAFFDSMYNLSSCADLIVKIDDVPMIVKIYLVNNEEFIENKKQIARKFVVDMIACMWISEINNNILILEDKDDFDYYMTEIVKFKPIIESIKNRCINLLKLTTTNVVPSRPYKDFSSRECFVCGFREFCSEKR